MDLKIDLGCGRKAREGYVGVDLNATYQPQIVADITQPIPGLDTGCADHVICLHVLEHIPGDGFHAAMLEMARLLKRGGVFEIRVPHPSSDCAMVQGHIHVYTPEWWRQMQRDDWFRGRLVVDRIEEIFDPQFMKDVDALDAEDKADPPPELMFRYLRNVYFETLVVGHKI